MDLKGRVKNICSCVGYKVCMFSMWAIVRIDMLRWEIQAGKEFKGKDRKGWLFIYLKKIFLNFLDEGKRIWKNM